MQILDGPFCELKPFAFRTATAARTAAATNTRKTATELYDIDKIATNSSIAKHVQGDVGLLRMVQQGAAWDAHITNKTVFTDNITCPLCGQCNADIVHLVWTCPHLDEQRKPLLDAIAPQLDTGNLHPALLHGIAPAMAGDPPAL